MSELTWRKSTRSGHCGECLEVAWTKSSRSADVGNDCLEVAPENALVLVRDSKSPAGPILSLTREAWVSFLAGISAGEFDHKVEE